MASHEQDAKPDEQLPNSEPVLAAISDQGRGFYRELLDRVDDGAYFVDRDRRLLFWNKAAEELTGFARSEVVGRLCPDNILCHADVNGRARCSDGCPLECPRARSRALRPRDSLRDAAPYTSPQRTSGACPGSACGVRVARLRRCSF